MRKALLLCLFAALAFCGCQKEPEPIKVTAVTLNVTSLSLVEGETGTIEATISPSNAENQKILWATNHPEIATVGNGIVTAVKEGTATITATSEDGGKTASCSVTVKAKLVGVESISLDKSEASLKVGETVTLTATVSPDDAIDKTVTWSSSNESVATVKDGVVTAVMVGSAAITAKAGEKTATCAVTVEPTEVTAISLNKSEASLKVGETVTLTATVSPDDATDKTITWSSNDESIATVKDGVVTAIKAGSTTITAKAGDKIATCVVVVKAEEEAEPFTITSKGSTFVCISKNVTPDNIVIEYRKETGSWSAYTIGAAIELTDGENVQFRAGEGGNNNFSKDNNSCYIIVVTGDGTVNASGNIMSLLDKSLERRAMPEYVFCGLFRGCDKLIDASRLILPSTTLAPHCYSEMFFGCTSLKSAPALPATTLADYCYWEMFKSCTSLTEAPALPATTLENGCYYGMFWGCKSLTSAPALPATTLAYLCYATMFDGCIKLTSAPELPATILAEDCYASMFYGCSSLTKAPTLPATTLASYCYERMFESCTSLKEAPALPATTLENGCYYYMFSDCTSLIKAPELPATILAEDCYASMFYGCSSLTKAPELPAITLAGYCYGSMFYGCSSLTKAPELPATTLSEGCYYNMFGGCSSLASVPKLPATTLAKYSYYSMFWGCSSLTEAPALPATTLAESCYYGMFWGCKSLTSAPELPATTLAKSCYCQMFIDCTSLTSAPVLPATTLAKSCYSNMFYGCTSLTSAPELPATTLTDYCYYFMFSDCSKLNYVKALFTTTPSANYTDNWLKGVSSTGTFVKSKDATWDVRGASGIPEGWAVKTE